MVNGFPLFHVAGAFVFGLSTLSAGGTLVVPGRLGMRNQTFMGTIWQQVERLNITTIGAVPTVLAALNNVTVDADIATMRFLLTGGSPLPTELADATETHTGLPVRNILGMTESAGTIAVEPVHAPRTPLSCGLRLPFTQVAIFGETDGVADPSKPCAAGETGIIATRGLTGRAKDIIIRGAHNIDPQMIETAAALGMPDPYAGELPVAFITTRDNWHPTSSELHAFLKSRIQDPVALPKRIQTLPTMPLTPIGKIFKPSLRAEAITWAIQAAAQTLDIKAELEVSPELTAKIRVEASKLKALKSALAGMPITLNFEATPK